MEIVPVDVTDLEALVAVALECQADPERHVTYASADAAALADEIPAVEGWTEATWVAREGAATVGWLLADRDGSMGRIWWWGPFVRADAPWDAVADALYGTARAALASFPEEEVVADRRSTCFPAFAARHAFRASRASALLTYRPSVAPEAPPGIAEPATVGERAWIAELHDRLFPGTHTPGAALVARDDPTRILRVERGAEGARGYLAAEHQHDGSVYVDFLGVDPDERGQGVGRRLVLDACREGLRRGATYLHLSVEESNTAARALYRSVGFAEERVAVPFRKGF